jgi:hypothetical protein
MKCECLFCYQPAVARLTVPHIKPKCAMCQKHLDEFFERARLYRSVVGSVVVEALTC